MRINKKILTVLFPLILTQAQAGVYIGLYSGYGGMHTDDMSDQFANRLTHESGLTSTTITNKRYGQVYRAAIGYLWRITPCVQLGVESGYMHYPNNTHTLYGFRQTDGYNFTDTFQYKGHYVDLLGVGAYAMGRLKLIGKIGVARITQSLTETVTAEEPATHQGGTSRVSVGNNTLLPVLGIGAAYSLNHHLSISVMGYHVDGTTPTQTGVTYHDTDAYGSAASVNTVVAGLVYHF